MSEPVFSCNIRNDVSQLVSKYSEIKEKLLQINAIISSVESSVSFESFKIRGENKLATDALVIKNNLLDISTLIDAEVASLAISSTIIYDRAWAAYQIRLTEYQTSMRFSGRVEEM